MTIVRTICGTGLSLLLATSAVAMEFEQYQQQFIDGVSKQAQEAEHYLSEQKREYAKYEQQLISAFDEYRSKAAAVWGEKDALIPDNKKWVGYSSDMQQRTVVDFENGVVKVELIVDENEPEKSKDLLLKAVAEALSAPPDERSIIDVVKDPGKRAPAKTSTDEALLNGLLLSDAGTPITKKNIESFSKQVVKAAETNETVGTDKKTRSVLSVEVPMVPDHIKRRADKYAADVNVYSLKYKVPPQVVYSVIETESYFNPIAKSHIPAFGLMQLVPSSGARDAYQFIYKKDKLLSESYLYNPKNNIELGAAYLNKIYSVYLKKIKNEESRLWCSVAAYNTGSGNVFRAFAGKYSKERHGSRSQWRQLAADKINSLSSAEVFSYMENNLPYEETRRYIVKVRDKMPKYQQR